ncbi:MAG: ATP-binding protein [Planctomycetota bacterium]
MEQEVWQRRVNRERAARNEAEAFLESKSRELYLANQKLTKMADAWRYENEKNQAILDNAAEGIVTFEADGNIATFNPAAERIFGISIEAAMLRNFDELFDDIRFGDGAEIDSYVLDEAKEYCATDANGNTRVLNVALTKAESNRAISFVAVIQDRTKKRALEAQLAVAQKMESVGHLAAGIAHEINTPIQYVGDNTRFLQEAFDDLTGLLGLYEKLLFAVEQGAATDTVINEIQKSAEEIDLEFLAEEIPQATEQAINGTGRVAKIVRAMKEFSHPGTEKQVAVAINHVLETAATVSRNEWKYVAEMETDFGEDVPDVTCYVGDLNQAFLNLIVNAAHAIEKRQENEPEHKGWIRISTRRVDEQVQLIFSDNGCGMSNDTKEKIFQPFFTTKPVGQGTGQGMSMVQRFIVERHSGSISVQSQEGAGSEISILLPVIPPR